MRLFASYIKTNLKVSLIIGVFSATLVGGVLIVYGLFQRLEFAQLKTALIMLGLLCLLPTLIVTVLYLPALLLTIFRSRNYLATANPAQQQDLRELLSQDLPTAKTRWYRAANLSEYYLILLPGLIIAKADIVACKRAGTKQYRHGQKVYLVKLTTRQKKNKKLALTTLKEAQAIVTWWKKE